jgi:hypothetical protein
MGWLLSKKSVIYLDNDVRAEHVQNSVEWGGSETFNYRKLNEIIFFKVNLLKYMYSISSVLLCIQLNNNACLPHGYITFGEDSTITIWILILPAVVFNNINLKM